METNAKKIVCLSCSPSKGRNSDSMLDAFLEGIQSVKGVSAEKIHLHDVEIDNYCFENSAGPLPHEKDFKELTEKIMNTNGLVIATPTYNFSVPAHLKNFIDRMRFFALDFENMTVFGQPKGRLGHLKLYFLVSGGTPVWVEKLFFFGYPAFWLRAVFLYHGAKYATAIYSGDVETYKNKKILTKCKKAGRKYANRIVHDRCNSILGRVFIRPPQSE